MPLETGRHHWAHHDLFFTGDVTESSEKHVTISIVCGMPRHDPTLSWWRDKMGKPMTFSTKHQTEWYEGGWWCTDDTHSLCINPNGWAIGREGTVNTSNVDTVCNNQSEWSKDPIMKMKWEKFCDKCF